jgi:ribonuclease HI
MKIVFTDGSASPNPGPGGFSVIDAETGNPLILGCSTKTTNIVMEGEAMGAAMEAFPEVEIHSDSEFWINVLTKWASSWANNGWKKKTGPIKNLDLVKRLYELYTTNKVTLIWVRGHVGTEMNEKADEWANNAREKKTFNDLQIIEIPPKEEE